MTTPSFQPRRVINIHAHIRRDADADAKIAAWKAQGAMRTCVLCTALGPGDPGWGVLNNDELLPLLERYPDHLIGFAGLDLSTSPDKPSVVGALRARGFRGLKCIRPARPYDDDAYMPLYEAAAKHGMPILFHTGYLSFPPAYRGPCVVDFMRPARLERIARYFPELSLIGAHLGMPWSEEAIVLALNVRNVYFDICGGSASAAWGSRMKRALAPFAGADRTNPDEHLALRLFREKLLFGTDNPPLERWIPRALDILDYLEIPEEARECFFWKTAARVLNLDLPMTADSRVSVGR